ncbi:protein of unknown function [Paenibacillus alvei]|uniref:Uncharacterized protein n=1 Tax=Paenibacillus alvei TaxID=44250 RepID=A0A383R6R0_PAEAL|nr:protein of unknown function [Paenibacillus alvei]
MKLERILSIQIVNKGRIRVVEIENTKVAAVFEHYPLHIQEKLFFSPSAHFRYCIGNRWSWFCGRDDKMG